MTVDLNTKCPCYNWLVGDEHNYERCKCCDCCEGFTPNETQVYCNYSQVPNCEPEFKKGDYAYRIDNLMGNYCVERVKVRNAIWRLNHWEYQFGRERHLFRGYKTEREALEVVCQNEVKDITERIKRLKKDMERCGLNIEDSVAPLLKQ